jgi:RimJ/RimL family protein N-acetyltransferase
MKTATSVMMHVASDESSHWMTPYYLSACFRYPFIQEGCTRITGLVRADNYHAQKFDEHLGFKREGQLRAACADGTDLIVYGMLKSECRFIEGKYYAALLRYTQSTNPRI